MQAVGRVVAEVGRTLVVAGVLRTPGLLPANNRHLQTSRRDHRRVQRLVALLTSGLLLVACSGGSRSTASPPPVAPKSIATTTTTVRTVPPASKVPTTTLPRSAPAMTTADRLAAQLTTAETAIRDPATPTSKLPTLGRSQQDRKSTRLNSSH